MEDRHYNDDGLIDCLYEVASVDAAHLERCAECRERWARLAAARKALLASPPDPALDARLDRQRRQILASVAESRPTAAMFRPMPAVALAGLVLLALQLSRPVPAPQPDRAASRISDTQFFAEISAVVESTEPDPAAPIRGLFQEKP